MTCDYCTRPEVTKVWRTDGPPATTMMALCTRHFWDWCAKSLQRRGLRAGEILQVHVDAGLLDDDAEDP